LTHLCAYQLLSAPTDVVENSAYADVDMFITLRPNLSAETDFADVGAGLHRSVFHTFVS
jgi:hypothetical protein